MLLWLLACTPSTPDDSGTPVGEPPQGALAARLGVWLPAGHFETRSRADVLIAGSRVSGTIREVWREPSPFFPDCDVAVELETTRLEGSTWTTWAGEGVRLEDSCGLEPYGDPFELVVTAMPDATAVPLLEEAYGVPIDQLESQRHDIAAARGADSVGWFLFWGPDEQTLWPLGFLYPEP